MSRRVFGKQHVVECDGELVAFFLASEPETMLLKVS